MRACAEHSFNVRPVLHARIRHRLPNCWRSLLAGDPGVYEMARCCLLSLLLSCHTCVSRIDICAKPALDCQSRRRMSRSVDLNSRTTSSGELSSHPLQLVGPVIGSIKFPWRHTDSCNSAQCETARNASSALANDIVYFKIAQKEESPTSGHPVSSKRVRQVLYCYEQLGPLYPSTIFATKTSSDA
eukprot:IDg19993t1